METEAQKWLDRIDSFKVSDNDREEFARWYRVPANQTAFDQVKRETDELKAMLSAISERPAIASLRQQILEKTDKSKISPTQSSSWMRSFNKWRAWSLSGGVAAAALVFLIAVVIPQQRNTHKTDIGEQRVVMLEDGTQVTLDTDTLIRVDFEKSQRNVRIQRGQAYFKVASNQARPFSVVSDYGIVTAVGTAFSVFKSSENLLVTLTEGKVQVATPNETAGENSKDGENRSIGKIVSLTPGEQLSYRAGRGVEKKTLDDINEQMSWLTGKLVFKSAKLSDVLASLNRYTENTIKVYDKELLATKVDAIFEVKDTKTSIIALRTMFNLDAFYDTDGSVELRRKNIVDDFGASTSG